MFLFAVETSVLIASITGLVTIITSALAGYFALKAAKQGKDNNVIVQATKEKIEVVDKKADTIHDLTNSNLAKVQAEFDVAKAEIKGLRELVAGVLAEREKGDKTATQIQLDQIQKDMKEQTTTSISASDKPVPVIDEKLAELLTPKLDKLQDTMDIESAKK